MKTKISEVTFTEFVSGMQYHYAADLDQEWNFSPQLYKAVREHLRQMAFAQWGYHNGATDKSVFVYLDGSIRGSYATVVK